MSLANPVGNNLDYFDALDLLPLRGFAGPGAVDPGTGADSSFFIDGDYASGAYAAAEWLESKIATSPDSAMRYMLFLVGAPGNGKSHIASQIQRGLQEIGPHRSANIHHRMHEYQHESGQQLTLINDATIPPHSNGGAMDRSALIKDIEVAISDMRVLVVNVNRGILYEELQATQSESIGRLIVEWLSEPDQSVSDIPDWSIDVDAINQRRSDDALKSLTIRSKSSNLSVCIVSVHLDRYSMLEISPKVKNFGETDSGFPEMQNTYKVCRFGDRTIANCENTPVGGLLSKFFSGSHFLAPPIAEEVLIDPFAANLENFRGEHFRQGFQNILRASELVSSHKLTYRELWGAISTAMIGSNSELMNHGIRNWLVDNQPPEEAGRERLNALMVLANFRTHQTIFGAAHVSLRGEVVQTRTPVTILTAAVDPARDAKPGWGKTAGWASYVLEAFRGQAEGESILTAMKELMQRDNDVAMESITFFDEQLDESITRSLDGTSKWLSDSEKQFVISWYGEYLVRMYALARGIPAFATELEVFTDTWNDAKRVVPKLSQTKAALRTLLLPYYFEDPSSRPVFLPLFNGRTEPIVDRTESPKLVVRVDSMIKIEIRTQGDAMTLELHAQDLLLSRMPLDFSLMREALACVQNYAGYTEKALSLTPRIERFRSSLLLNNKPKEGYFALAGSQMSEISTTEDGIGQS